MHCYKFNVQSVSMSLVSCPSTSFLKNSCHLYLATISAGSIFLSVQEKLCIYIDMRDIGAQFFNEELFGKVRILNAAQGCC